MFLEEHNHKNSKLLNFLINCKFQIPFWRNKIIVLAIGIL